MEEEEASSSGVPEQDEEMTSLTSTAEYDDTKKCPVTGFTDRQKYILEKSWKKLIGTTPREFKAAGVNLLLWMFDNIPKMRARFTKFSANSSKAALIADEMFLAHTQSVILSVDSLIRMLTNPDKLEKKVRALARSHLLLNPPVNNEYFGPFKEKFHLFIEGSLGLSPDDERVQLWTAFLGVLVAVIDEEEKALGSQTSKGSCCIVM